jgi:hypothetical protein
MNYISKASKGSLTFPVDKLREIEQEQAGEVQALFHRFKAALRAMAVTGGLVGVSIGWITFPLAVRTGLYTISEPVYPRPIPGPADPMPAPTPAAAPESAGPPIIPRR